VAPKVNMSWLDTRQHYRDKLFALVDRRLRSPDAPLIQDGADDVASHLTGRDLVVLPEDIGLFSLFVGDRGGAARSVPPDDPNALVLAIGAMFAPYGPWTAYYEAKFPELASRQPPLRQLTAALTDTFARVGLETFAEIAQTYGVWLHAGVNMPQRWQVVCTDMAAFNAASPPRIPGGVPCEEESPAKVQQLRDPAEPERDYAYEALSPDTSNMALLFDPGGRLVTKQVKTYITPTEMGPDEGQVGLDFVNGPVTGGLSPVRTPVGTLGFVTSKDAWMPDAVQKLDQGHVDLLVQPEFFVENFVSTEGGWNPDVLLASGYNDVLRHPSFESLVMPQLTGGVYSFYADHQSHIAVKPRTGRERSGFLVGQPPHRGLVDVAPWVVEDPVRAGEPFAARRKRLGEAGDALKPGGGPECPDPRRPGPCDDGHVEGVIWRDLIVNRQPRYRRYRGGRAKTRWSRARPLSRSRRVQRNVAVARRGRLVVAAYEERRGARDQVLLVRSRDGGRSWSRPSRPAGRPRGATDEWWPAVALGSRGRVVVAWSELSDGKARVHFARSVNGGRRFGAPRAVSSSPAPQWKPALAADPRRDLFHVAWVDEQYAQSGDERLPEAGLAYAAIAGGVPREPRRLDTGEPVPFAVKHDNAWAPSVATHGGRVLVTWIDFLNYDWDVFSRASTDRGKSWKPQQLVNDTPDADEELADTPRATFIGNRPLIAWTDWRKRASSATRPHQMYDIYAAQPGKKNVQVDPYGTRQLSTFAPDACGELVAFQDASKGQNDIRIVRMKRGRTRGKAGRVDDAGPRAGNAWRPRLACSGRDVLAAWEDERDGPGQIYFARARQGQLR
jgi:predicted amidohydrolase